MKSNMRNMHRQNQVVNPNQYFKEDDMGNYVYAYDDQFTEKKEEGNHLGDVQGHYAYTMPNGIQRQVNYVADNNGFHVRDNADPARIKRSVEPDLLRTRMTSVMDSARNVDTSDIYRMSNIMGRDMSSNMIGMLDRYSNMMSRNSMDQGIMDQTMMGLNMMGSDNMERNMMARNIYNVMSNRGINHENMMSRNMPGQDMNSQMMERNMMGQDMTSEMMGRNMMAHQNMNPNMMYRNTIGRSMGMSNNRHPSVNNGLIGQRMMQKMAFEQMPETFTSTRFL